MVQWKKNGASSLGQESRQQLVESLQALFRSNSLNYMLDKKNKESPKTAIPQSK